MSRRAAAFGLVVLVAALFRLPALDRIPPGLFIDEAQNGIDAWAIAQGEGFPVFVEGSEGLKGRGREPLIHYLLAVVFRLVDPSVEALRSPAALAGTATVALVFLTLERLSGLRLASLSSLLLAVSFWHASTNRIAFRANLVPFALALCALLAVRLAQRQTRAAAACFGAGLGLGTYTYYAWWVIPPALVFVLALAALRDPWSRARRSAALLGIAAAAWLLVSAPLLAYAIRHPDQYLGRVEETLELRAPVGQPLLLDRAQRVLFMLHFRGDHEPRHNIPGKPHLDPVSGMAFLIGLYWLLRTLPRGLPVKLGILLLWLLPLAPSAVTDDVPNGIRALGAIPAVCVIAGIGLDRLWRLGRAGVAAVCLALAAAAAINARDLFVVWPRDPRVVSGFSGDIPPFVKMLADLSRDSDVHLSPYVFYSPATKFLNLRYQAPFRLIEDESALAGGPAARPRVLVSEFPALNLLIETLYPRAEVVARYAVWTARDGRVYRIAPGDVRAALGPGEARQARAVIGAMTARSEAQRRAW